MMKKVVIATGGTGGHIFPAEALTEELLNSGIHPIVFCDSRSKQFLKGVFKKTEVVEIVKVKQVHTLYHKLVNTIRILFAIVAAKKALRAQDPDCVVSFGGYAAFPTLFAAAQLGIPIVLHESNAVIGRVNKFFLKKAEAITLLFPFTKGINACYTEKMYYTGNPIRAHVLKDAEKRKDSMSKKRLLIIGGSQGARILGDIVPQALLLLPAALKKKLVVHQQAREEQVKKLEDTYESAEIKAKVAAFFDDIGKHMAEADVVIARAGASTISEIIQLEKAAILVPYALAKDNHQYYNAKYLVDNKAAIMITERELSPNHLANQLKNLLEEPRIGGLLINNLSRLVRENPAGEMCKVIINIIGDEE
jgi:UDP-N-acetylglucosamine--N-acetylmuramyl-(pentapeptide) pyrophosphoryl-undecaprenol N-acetylglucosamine transferase